RRRVDSPHERPRRQQGRSQHAGPPCRPRGPVVRSEACAEDFYKALDAASDRLERRFRQAADRRRVHHGRRTPTSLAAATARSAVAAQETTPALADEDEIDDGPGRVVREKEHPAKPMTVDQALFEMELVGHDFYLFSDVDTGRPSVVYRRRAYDYGLIRLAI